MAIDRKTVKNLLDNHSFKDLFIEQLGWDNLDINVPIQIGNDCFELKTVAEKKGFTALLYPGIPDSPTRSKITNRVSKSFREHLIIYADKETESQKWQWVRRIPNQPLRKHEHDYNSSQPMLLIEKIGYMEVPLEEEDKIDIVDMYEKVRSAMEVDRVTKKFYDHFKKNQKTFQDFIKGIPGDEDKRWYSSVMLNRLMFIYFIQKRGFLDSDVDYLRNRLNTVQKKKGLDKFQTFYKYFLIKLCHEALNKSPEYRNLDQDLVELIGNVPYLNGGIFQEHKLEKQYPDIDIPDKAFEEIFDFFDQYEWHLDNRSNAVENEINPDVLGYIFEKYINQKQMGAYYTKEDITDYISKNTIIPFLFDRACEKCKVAFESSENSDDTQNTVWTLLQQDPDKYIYPAVSHGIVWDIHQSPTAQLKNPFPLPPEIEQGIDPDKHDLFERRKHWNEPASPECGLPTEIWRETVARRERYNEIHQKLVSGKIESIDDLITYNLDIRQFAQDVIENCEGPELLVAFWKAIESISILDPACGSGAFLFAALNILEPLYDACIKRMRFFLEEWGEDAKKNHPNYTKKFSNVLHGIGKHPSYHYFIYKSIIINNLYGVDIMEEAVEICQLRLFLKLVSQIEGPNSTLEPLPDIDFNIRAGNSLVGFASLEEVKDALPDGTYLGGEEIARIEEEAEMVDRAFRRFHEMQTEQDMKPSEFAEAKQDLGHRLEKLNSELDMFLAGLYNVNVEKKTAFEKWKKSHQPFHWLSEFYGIISRDGFDVIIGNPPYVEYSKVKKSYTITGYRTESCGNLYAYMIERSYNTMYNGSRMGMIVQLPIVCTDRMKPLQKECLEQSINLWFADFDDRPARLFDGLQHIRATIFTSQKNYKNDCCVYSTTYNRWYSEERPLVFETLSFCEISDCLRDGAIPKIGHSTAKSIMDRITNHTILSGMYSDNKQYTPVFFHNAPQYWIRAMTFVPYFWNERDGEKVSNQIKEISLGDTGESSVIASMLSCSLFYWWFIILSDCRHLNLREVDEFPVGLERMSNSVSRKLEKLSEELMNDLKKHAVRKECNYRTTGKVIYDEFYLKYSKPIMDEIDRTLADHYGFTDEELDFIINYDIKYRMGSELNEDSE